MNVFVVVDMQVGFAAARDRALIDRIEAAADKYASEGWAIVHIKYDGSGESTVRLPDGAQSLWKPDANGGDAIYSFLMGAGAVDKELSVHLAGVNLSHCVYKSALGLAIRLSDEHGLSDHVTIVQSLCGDDDRSRVRFV